MWDPPAVCVKSVVIPPASLVFEDAHAWIEKTIWENC